MPNASGGADEAEALDKLVYFVAKHDFVSGEEKHVEEIRAERQALGLAPLPPDERHLNYVADVASCDFCGTPEAGKHHCSRCEWMEFTVSHHVMYVRASSVTFHAHMFWLSMFWLSECTHAGFPL